MLMAGGVCLWKNPRLQKPTSVHSRVARLGCMNGPDVLDATWPAGRASWAAGCAVAPASRRKGRPRFVQQHHVCTAKRPIERHELQERFVYYKSIIYALPDEIVSARSPKSVSCTTEASLLYHRTTTWAPRAPGTFRVLPKHYFCTTG